MDWKPGVEVVVDATVSASQRTKNRVNENGPVFTVKDHSMSPLCLSGQQGVHLVSRKTAWFGWLPVDELELLEVLERR